MPIYNEIFVFLKDRTMYNGRIFSTSLKVRCTTNDDCQAGALCQDKNACVLVSKLPLMSTSQSFKIKNNRKMIHTFLPPG